MSSTSQVDNELAALKAELGTGGGADGHAPRCRHRSRRPTAGRRRRGRLMAISRNIKPDRGLTYRMLMTGFFFVVLYAVFIGILFAFLHSLVLILVIAVGVLFCQYWFSAKIAMYAMHAKEVTPEQAPELHGVVDRLCALADMPKPKVAHRHDGHPQRLRHRPQPQGRRRLRDLRPAAPARGARGRGGALARALARGPPRRRGHDDRQRARA